jgi:C-terminal binding-module, SLH-like, of glucodextranase
MADRAAGHHVVLWRALLVGAASAGLLLATAGAAGASTSPSLWRGPAPRPGPAILYAGLAKAPQLSNRGIWDAPPILVSGASAYRDGEFLYQDFLYDDHGAVEAQDPLDPKSAGDTFSRPDGTYTYPTDPAYANNAADLVEFRAKPLTGATAFRVTLNTMKDPALVGFSVAIGGTAGTSYPFPDGANVSAPADLFLTVHPSGSSMLAELVQASSGAAVAGPAPKVSVDTTRHQVEVRISHAQWNPGTQVVRLALGVGLWDGANNRYLLPQGSATATAPGGSGSAANPPAFFNVAFRSDAQEPVPTVTDPSGVAMHPQWWREEAQATALASGDISQFSAAVDFAKLAAGVDDESAVPQTGPFDRILASHFTTAPGADFSVNCFPTAVNGGADCPGQYQGNLQPYAIYVPPSPAPKRYGLTLLLHSLGANYNQYLGSRNQSQFALRKTGSITITPESRGPDGFNDGYAGADVFEVWADVAARYPLDPDWTVITGYSMGGMGTFKLAEQFPDLFAKAQPTVGYSASTSASTPGLIASLRNIPFLMWNMATDELVPESSYLPTAEALDAAGYRYQLDVYSPGDHLTLAINDQYAPAAAFLGNTSVKRNPAHVTFVVDPGLDYPSLGFVADHAYWLSAITERDTTQATGTIDVFSHGFGTGDPAPSATQSGSGTLTGGTFPALGYASQSKTWGPVPAIAVSDQLDITATNVSAVSVDPARARVDCNATLDVSTDGPLTVTLIGCPSGTSHWGA